MNRAKARKLVRKAIIAIQRYWDITTEAELEILGSMVDWPSDAMAEKVKQAATPESISAFKESQKSAPPAPLEDILSSAAVGATDDEIEDDAWIDGVIEEIRANFRGVAILGDDDELFIFEP